MANTTGTHWPLTTLWLLSAVQRAITHCSTRWGCRGSDVSRKSAHSPASRSMLGPGRLVGRPVVGQEFTVEGDDHSVAAGVFASFDGETEVDGAHDAVAELFVDQLLDRRTVYL